MDLKSGRLIKASEIHAYMLTSWMERVIIEGINLGNVQI